MGGNTGWLWLIVLAAIVILGAAFAYGSARTRRRARTQPTADEMARAPYAGNKPESAALSHYPESVDRSRSGRPEARR
jgi:hypothetical protein